MPQTWDDAKKRAYDTWKSARGSNGGGVKGAVQDVRARPAAGAPTCTLAVVLMGRSPAAPCPLVFHLPPARPPAGRRLGQPRLGELDALRLGALAQVGAG